MRTYPTKADSKDIKELNVQPWMVELLRMNPAYPHWGPHEDYMMKKGSGWDCPMLLPTWKELDLKLDELNEVVHFYFELHRDSKKCETCDGSGYHPDASWVTDSFYAHSSPFLDETTDGRRASDFLNSFSLVEPLGLPLRRGQYPPEELIAKYKPEFRHFCEQMRDTDGQWNDKITQDEFDVLVKEGRLSHDSAVTLDSINASQRGGRSIGHDGINRMILIKARLARYGMPNDCHACKGRGFEYTIPEGYPGLVLWLLHPRKGCSRGVEIKKIERDDLPAIKKYLQYAAKRNADRFKKVFDFKIPRGK